MARSVFVCIVVLGVLATSHPVQGQRGVDFANESNWLVGYVANAPQQLLGAGTMIMPSARHRWGLYGDVKVRTGSPAGDDLDRSLTPAEAEARGAEFFSEEAAWTTVNLAVVRGVNQEFAFYLGGGVAWRTTYLRYIEEQVRQYWVVDDDESGVFPNVLGGVFLRATPRVVFQFGVEAAPAGGTVGIHYRLR